MRLRCGLLVGLVLLLGCTKQADSEQASGKQANKEEIYFVRQLTTVKHGGRGMPVAQSSFSGITVSKQSDGALTTRQRTLWSWQAGGGSASGTLSLNPNDADDKQVLALLGSGFEASLNKDGSLKTLKAVDQSAFDSLVQAKPEAAAIFTSRDSSLTSGVMPLTLPEQVRVGQEFVRQEQSGKFGTLSSRMRVTALTDEVALVDIELSGGGVQGGGQQAIRRRDGMPIELQFELTREADDKQPAISMQLTANNMAYSNYMTIGADATLYKTHRQALQRMLAKPPFSAQSDDPKVYRLQPASEADMPSWMLSTAALDAIEKGLSFGLDKDHNAHRPLIVLKGKMPGSSPASFRDAPTQPLLLAELRKATLMDASGRELPDLATIPTHRKILFMDSYRSTELDIDFPFRLPLQTRAAQLTELDTIRLDVGVETYALSGTETLKVGAQSKDNAQLRIEWLGPQRVTLAQTRGHMQTSKGTWTVAVPLDADGKQIPSAALLASAFVDQDDPQRPYVHAPLDWELRNVSSDSHIATAQPIAALQLRHYAWEQVPRQWNIRATP
ncbi:hypothetical protein FXN63_12325 [Pigmentiphaga aceris]|uniref:Lipoprotein n=1 Tax=Pigmentiphaga aceris TaxID=1940612 RepID=A0A5C0AVX8_9BURK|nr:hypothetical protein [Pigmentiphaga aceris]QEI06529.1 hypothetical protein FXN63_12325 [Pigmentiphaga aceris]